MEDHTYMKRKLFFLIMTLALIIVAVPMPGGEVYAASRPRRVTISSIKANSTTAFTVKWKKVSCAKGYQIRYSTKPSMSKAKALRVTSKSKKITKLKAGTKYYVQVRAYKKKGHRKVYSKWSKKKSVTTYYSIKYVLNGGTQASGQRKSYTKSSETFRLKPPTRSGYVFDGWYTTSSYKTKVTAIKKGTKGNKTFYAKWSVADIPNTTGTNLSAYLRATTNCQVGNQAIKTLTESLTAGLSTDSAKAKAIFNYVRDQIAYEEYKDSKYGAVVTMDRKSGNSADQAHLLIAMLRTAGIPARYHHGICTFTDGTITDHVWVEYTFDGATWHALDPTSTRNSFDSIKNWDTGSYVNKGTYSSLPF